MKGITPQVPEGGALPSRGRFHGSSNGETPNRPSDSAEARTEHASTGTGTAPTHLAAAGVNRRSLSSKYNVNTQTGGVSCTIPIGTSPARGGFEPELSLQYSSGMAGVNGLFGVGWALDGVDYITRKTSKGVPRYDEEDEDTFVHSRLGDLVSVDKATGSFSKDGFRMRKYRPRFEADPIMIQRWSNGTETFWKTISSSNVATVYGRHQEHQIHDQEVPVPGRKSRIFIWLACESYDSYGNHIKYTYKMEDDIGTKPTESEIYESHRHQISPQKYLKSIQYGNVQPSRDLERWDTVVLPTEWLFEVIFDYGEHDDEHPKTCEDRPWSRRSDPFSVYNSGFEIRTYRLCRRVLMYHHFATELGREDCLVSSTSFTYSTSSLSGTAQLRSYTYHGHLPKGNVEYWTVSQPAVEFEYSQPPELDDLPIEEMHLPISGITDHDTMQWIDLDGEGAPGVLAKGPGGTWLYQRNLTSNGVPKLGEQRVVHSVPNVASVSNWDFEDLRLDGLPAVVITSDKHGLRGYYEREEENGDWLNFVPFESYPINELSESRFRVDLNGDGHADLLTMVPAPNGELSWHPSQGPRGFGAAQSTINGPILALQSPSSSVQFCDMTGDGLADIVQISNGSVCYWPNMGHGVFGARVAMGNSPWMTTPEQFSPQCIRVHDITGSGTTDLVYLHPSGGAAVYYNCSGNTWSEAYQVHGFPPISQVSAVDILDIRGRGTPCLCWTSDLHSNSSNGLTTMRFIDLMPMQKPGLLAKWSNGTGTTTTFEYQSSFSFYTQDELKGVAWTTKLPFPVQCVAKTVTVDHISDMSQTMRYAFHNGYYDHEERKFRGFQLVDSWDAEKLVTSGSSGFDRPPVLTRTWFNTGSPTLDRSAQLPQRYEVSAPRHTDIDASAIVMDGPEEVEDSRDGYRAMAGRERRIEVFSVDASDAKSALPYMITQKRYEAVVSKSVTGGLVTRVNEREEVVAHYERLAEKSDTSSIQLAADEGRVQQRLVLDTDKFGSILLEASIHYGKYVSDLEDPYDRVKQQETVVTYTQKGYTQAHESHDYFRTPMIATEQQYRIFPSDALQPRRMRYSWSRMAEHKAALLTTPKELPLESGIQKCVQDGYAESSRLLLSKALTIYTSGDLQGSLPCGCSEPYSLVYQSYQLAFSVELLHRAFNETLPATPAAENEIECLMQAGYIELVKGSGQWWTASTRQHFGDGTGRTQLETARRSFYTTDRETDAFDNTTTTSLDNYHLLAVKSTNALGSVIQYENNYALLQPFMVTDANMNRICASYDPLGRPIGSAMMGKESAPLGNNFKNFQQEIDEKAFFSDPIGLAPALLANASGRTIYSATHSSVDIDADSARLDEPRWIAQLTRHENVGEEQDSSNGAQISINFQYLNGISDVIQTAQLSDISKSSRGITQQWDINGWVVNDNKGQPVQRFRPFQASSHHFQRNAIENSRLAETLLRDPLDRVVASLKADHGWSKTRFTPWEQVQYSAGNTVLIADPALDDDVGHHFRRLDRSLYFPTWHGQRVSSSLVEGSAKLAEKVAANRSEIYATAFIMLHLDTLGRTIYTGNGSEESMRESRSRYSIRGDLIEIQDSLGRVVDTVVHDLLGRALYKKNLDSGERWSFLDSEGRPLMTWSGRKTRKRFSYDALRREDAVFLLSPTEDSTSEELCITRKMYGESVPAAASSNLIGQIYHCYDQAGLSTNAAFDFQGLCIASSLRYAVQFQSVLDWSSRSEEPEFESIVHESKSSYNALGMMTHSTEDNLRSVARDYDVAGRLKSLRSSGSDEHGSNTASIHGIEYEADGMISRTVAQNGVETRYTYDQDTRRLIAAKSLRSIDQTVLQEVSYTYDVLGKVVQTTTRVGLAPARAEDLKQDFEYNQFGDLVSATGRMQADPGSKHLAPYDFRTGSGALNPGGKAIRYKETYTYDKVGNMKTMQNVPESGYFGWTRRYTYAESSNRLLSTEVRGETQHYRYDGEAGKNGCMTFISGYSSLQWDFDDRLRAFSTQQVSEGKIPETTWYIYNADGIRVRKVTVRSSNASQDSSTSGPIKIKETKYLAMGEMFSRYQGDGVATSLSTTIWHLGDAAFGNAPIATVETGSHLGRPLPRYRLSEQVELDDEAKIIWHQETSPFGAVTWQAIKSEASREYRFASYRWDRESGLYHCGARYYACWLGRWISADPLGTIDGLNPYVYAGNDPINFHDPGGTMIESNKTRSGTVNTVQKVESKPAVVNQWTRNRGKHSQNLKAKSETIKQEAKDAPQGASSSQGAASQATGSSSAGFSPCGPVSGHLLDLKNPPKDHVVLYRATDTARARQFYEEGNTGSVTMRDRGDFSHTEGGASYWSDSDEAARSHTKFAGQREQSLLAIAVPVADLQGATRYPTEPNAAWENRVNADRVGSFSDAFTEDERNQVLEDRRAEISIGPESGKITAAFEKKARRNMKLSWESMKVLQLADGSYATQYSFSGTALTRLPTYQMNIMYNIPKVGK